MKIEKISEDDFEKEVLQATKPILVDFYADWCSPCTIMAPILEEIAEEVKEKVEVAKINVDENQDLAIKYDIMSIPTLVLFNNGKIEKSFSGVRSKSEILEAL